VQLVAVVVFTVATVPLATVVDLKEAAAAAAMATSVAVDAVIAVTHAALQLAVLLLCSVSMGALPLRFLLNCMQTEVEREHWEKVRQSMENPEVKILTDQDWIDFLPGRGFKAGVDYPISLYYK
jgi:hypothetical protein